MCKVEIQETQNESTKGIEELEAVNKRYHDGLEDIAVELEQVSLPRISGINLAAIEMDEEIVSMLASIEDGKLDSIEFLARFLPQLRARLMVILDAMCMMRQSTERMRDDARELIES